MPCSRQHLADDAPVIVTLGPQHGNLLFEYEVIQRLFGPMPPGLCHFRCINAQEPDSLRMVAIVKDLDGVPIAMAQPGQTTKSVQ